MKYLMIYIAMNLLLSCSEGVQDSVSGEWLIPKDLVFDGGPGKDGIPSIQNPEKIPISEVDFLNESDQVVVYARNQQIHVYPHRILDWHEIINDQIDGISITVSYCPLTGSAIGLNGNIHAAINTTFGVSGLLFNSNLILYDRDTDSYWSQMKNLCVAGPLRGKIPQNEVIAETTFGTIKDMFDDGLVVSNNTGIYLSGQYNIYPYGSYKSSNSLLFPVEHQDGRFHKKERILGVFNEEDAKAYAFSLFSDSTSVITDIIGGEKILVVGNSQQNFMVAYKRYWQNSQQELTFSIAMDMSSQAIFQDNLGNRYNLLGQVIAGSDVGKRLAGIHSYIAFWFSLVAFYPDLEVYQ